jgi:hypothetical protein
MRSNRNSIYMQPVMHLMSCSLSRIFRCCCDVTPKGALHPFPPNINLYHRHCYVGGPEVGLPTSIGAWIFSTCRSSPLKCIGACFAMLEDNVACTSSLGDAQLCYVQHVCHIIVRCCLCADTRGPITSAPTSTQHICLWAVVSAVKGDPHVRLIHSH